MDLFGCLTWPVQAAASPTIAAPSGLPPVVVLAATWDGVTPLTEAAPLASALGTGVVLTRDGFGHTSMFAMAGSRCLQDATTAYLVKLQPPAPGTVCKDAPLKFGP